MGVIDPLGQKQGLPQAVLHPVGLRRVQRYLLPTVLAGIVTARVGDRFPLLVDVVALGAVALCLRAVYKVAEYWWDWFVVTDARLLLTQGLYTRKVAVMPLTKVTDMSYNVSILGRL